MPQLYQLTTHDGLVIDYRRYGPSDGLPVVFHNGTPDTSLLSDRLAGVVAACGVSLLVADRPGYGGSTRRPGRTVAGVVSDVVELADALGWDRFATMGMSGGGPHALACAALLPGRVLRCAAVSAPAPYDADGLDWYAAMSPGNVEEFTAASRGEGAYRPLLERLAREAIDAAERGEPAIASGYELSEVDLARLAGRSDDPGHVPRIRAAYGSVDGWVDDGLALVRPWGFELSSIAVPTSVWCGLSDVLCPPGHAEWLISHIPAAQRRELPGGHYLTGEDIGRVLRWLTDPAQPGLGTEPGTA